MYIHNLRVHIPWAFRSPKTGHLTTFRPLMTITSTWPRSSEPFQGTVSPELCTRQAHKYKDYVLTKKWQLTWKFTEPLIECHNFFAVLVRNCTIQGPRINACYEPPSHGLFLTCRRENMFKTHCKIRHVHHIY